MQQRTSPWFRMGAAAVHLYTASGAVLALLIVLAAIERRIVDALWIGLVAFLVDSTDGTLARRFRVSETLPWFDGRRLDDIVDYLTYVFAPMLLLWMGGYLPAGNGGVAIASLPLLASTYQFCRADAKTEDHFFLGFPSYWNIVAFYIVVFALSPAVVAALLAICSLLVFVPIRYVYPSRTVALRPLTLVLTALWVVLLGAILMVMPERNTLLSQLSLLYLVYYVGLSLYLTLKRESHAPAVVSSDTSSG